MTRHERQRFEDIYVDTAIAIEDVILQKCVLVACELKARHPARRPLIRRVRAESTKFADCVLTCAIVEDATLIDFVGAGHRNSCWGTAFRHVVIRGKFGDEFVDNRRNVPSLAVDPALDETFAAANARYYADTDWALDVSEVECVGLSLRGVPAHLVRRDARSQAVVRRANVMRCGEDWKRIAGPWDSEIQIMLDARFEDIVLIAPKRSKRYQIDLDAIKALRDAGIADPD